VAVTGDFEGFYRFGFEESSFAVCGDTGQESTWVVIPDSVHEAGPHWPKGNGRTDSRIVYARWTATVAGPGRYGQMSASTSLMEVHAIAELRRVRRTDCGGRFPVGWHRKRPSSVPLAAWATELPFHAIRPGHAEPHMQPTLPEVTNDRR
jgi:hypothetical protein